MLLACFLSIDNHIFHNDSSLLGLSSAVLLIILDLSIILLYDASGFNITHFLLPFFRNSDLL